MYEVSAGVNDVEVLKVPLTGTFQIDIAKTIDTLEKQNPKLVFICSPNNPTGNSFKTEDILTVAGTSRGIVVVDEAYIDFSEKQSLLPLLNKFPNIVVMQTFSKAFGMAAIRAGMAFANKEIIGYFNKLKYPYNVSTLSQKAIIARLGRPHLKEKHVRAIIAERKKLERALARLNYVKQVYQSDANFLLVKVTDADLLYSTLLGSGIVTRNRNSIIDGCVRITVGTRKENRLLMEALKSIKL
jgi:histidinol-phosphate aminotransferase